MWQHLEVCPEIQASAKNHSPRGPGTRVWSSGEGAARLLRRGGTCPPNLLAFPEHLAKGDAEEVMHLDF